MNDPAQEWKASLNSTLNRLSNQYLTLLRAASSEVALDDAQIDQRSKFVCGFWVFVHYWPFLSSIFLHMSYDAVTDLLYYWLTDANAIILNCSSYFYIYTCTCTHTLFEKTEESWIPQMNHRHHWLHPLVYPHSPHPSQRRIYVHLSMHFLISLEY